MKKIFYSIIAVVASLWSGWVFSATPAEELASTLKKMQTFQSQFAQRIRDPHGEHIAKSKGKVLISRPNQFYWKAEQPDPVLVVADGKFLWTYDMDLAQVTKQNLAAALKNSPATLLAGSVTNLTKDFTVAYAKSTQCKKAIDHCYVLKPKQKDSHIAEIVIGFAKDNLAEIRMQDALGQDIYTQFTQVKLNQNINKKIFTFVPPKGVDVIQPQK